ncbi:nuclear transport factor 2 family protein [Nocardia jiangxiensis]|uniref:nuclear transport factor 2 family protein n=1 Tax=Nocardia jiangxiensis TaxID=282685 RepID=UPI0002E60B16|nr:nuclear transport factor 2 family protein [Nocardia jiangxiensis]
MDHAELIAREKVRDLVAAYAHSGDRMRLAELAGCFAEDGILEVKGRPPAVGRAAIIEMLSAAPDRGAESTAPRIIRHFVTNLRFDSIAPGRIETSSYFVVLTADGPDHWGRYRDILVEAGERWLFAHRLVAVDAAVPGGWFVGRQPARP